MLAYEIIFTRNSIKQIRKWQTHTQENENFLLSSAYMHYKNVQLFSYDNLIETSALNLITF